MALRNEKGTQYHLGSVCISPARPGARSLTHGKWGTAILQARCLRYGLLSQGRKLLSLPCTLGTSWWPVLTQGQLFLSHSTSFSKYLFRSLRLSASQSLSHRQARRTLYSMPQLRANRRCPTMVRVFASFWATLISAPVRAPSGKLM